MTPMPPSPFLNSAASFPAASESAAAVEAAPTIAAAEPISNSADQLMLPTDTATVLPRLSSGETVAVPISVIRHNPITRAVEVRSQHSSDDGVENRATSDNVKCQERVADLETRSATIQHQGSPTGSSEATNHIGEFRSCAVAQPDLGTDHIGEIFFGAAKIDNRRAEDFINWQDFEAALDPLPLFIRDGKHLKRRAA